MFVLIFTCTDDAVAGTIGYDVYSSEIGDGEGNYFGDGLAGTNIAEGTETVFMPVLHGGEVVFEGSAYGEDEVVLVETGTDEAAAHVSCAAEDLRWTS